MGTPTTALSPLYVNKNSRNLLVPEQIPAIFRYFCSPTGYVVLDQYCSLKAANSSLFPFFACFSSR